MNTPTKHKHADLIMERARQDATGETAAGWWRWEVHDNLPEKWVFVSPPAFTAAHSYRYSMSDKHPLLKPPKPKLQLVDMSKLPVGSALSIGGVLHRLMTPHYTVFNEATKHSYWTPVGEARIAEQQQFTYWGGGECPVPEGLVVEAVFREDGSKDTDRANAYGWRHDMGRADIIAYRIIGLAEGWTDNPEGAS